VVLGASRKAREVFRGLWLAGWTLSPLTRHGVSCSYCKAHAMFGQWASLKNWNWFSKAPCWTILVSCLSGSLRWSRSRSRSGLLTVSDETGVPARVITTPRRLNDAPFGGPERRQSYVHGLTVLAQPGSEHSVPWLPEDRAGENSAE
jgi:hypothetical protein